MNEFIDCFRDIAEAIPTVFPCIFLFTAMYKAVDYFDYRRKVKKGIANSGLTREEILEVIKVLEEKKQQRIKREDPKK
ncbi:MAG: hypothetical protein E7510_10780 [Ruminococcus sp.]|nr:hypothetical protein [Ruminococcus sp.]